MAASCLACKRCYTKMHNHTPGCRLFVVCVICAKRVPGRLLARHVACHAGRIADYAGPAAPPVVQARAGMYSCPTCRTPFVRLAMRDRHVKQCKLAVVPPAPRPDNVEIIDVDPALIHQAPA